MSPKAYIFILGLLIGGLIVYFFCGGKGEQVMKPFPVNHYKSVTPDTIVEYKEVPAEKTVFYPKLITERDTVYKIVDRAELTGLHSELSM